MMKIYKIVLIVFWVVTAGLFSMAIWGGWAERAYEREKERYWPWYWLNLFRVPLTRENCVRFVKGSSLLGLVLITLGTLVVLLTRG
jgi:hypothetical protein